MSKEEKTITLVVENLENILKNPANNNLHISVMEVIETSVRLLKVESTQLTAYNEALRELVENVEKLNLNLFGTDYTVYVNNIKDNLTKAKTLIE